MSATDGKWIIVLVAFDDDALTPQVIKERIPAGEDEHLIAFLRGGELLEVLSADEDESTAEACRRQIEKQCLR